MGNIPAWILYQLGGVIETGGIAIIPMFALGAYGFFLLLQAFTQPAMFRSRRMLRELDSIIRAAQSYYLAPSTQENLYLDYARYIGDDNQKSQKKAIHPILQIVTTTLPGSTPAAPEGEQAVRILLRERLSFLFYSMMRHLAIIRVLAAAAPLLGLLGTVSGLIHTFDAMHRFGFGNSGLLASGISEALQATQCGLALAILLLLIGIFQEGHVLRLKDEVESRLATLLRCLYTKEADCG